MLLCESLTHAIIVIIAAPILAPLLCAITLTVSQRCTGLQSQAARTLQACVCTHTSTCACSTEHVATLAALYTQQELRNAHTATARFS